MKSILEIISSPEFQEELAKEISQELAKIDFSSLGEIEEEICRHCEQDTKYCSCPVLELNIT